MKKDKKIRGWSYDLDGHCSGVGYYKTKDEAIKDCKRMQATGRDLKDDHAKSFNKQKIKIESLQDFFNNAKKGLKEMVSKGYTTQESNTISFDSIEQAQKYYETKIDKLNKKIKKLNKEIKTKVK